METAERHPARERRREHECAPQLWCGHARLSAPVVDESINAFFERLPTNRKSVAVL
jgi:hypothetical protein